MHEPSRRRMLLGAVALVAGTLAAHRALSEAPAQPMQRPQQIAHATPAPHPSR
jgi:hypothetical protein